MASVDTGQVTSFGLTVTYGVCTPFAGNYQNYLPLTVR